MGTTAPLTALRDTEPAATLLARVRNELAADFVATRPIRISRAPGRLDVMGGIADYTGSLVCEYPLDRAAAVALQQRADRQLQIFSFNLFDEHKPFTFRIPLDALASQPATALRREFNVPASGERAGSARKWAAYVAGCLFALHDAAIVDVRNPAVLGVNLAVYSTVPQGAGVSSSAALEVAAMMGLASHFGAMDHLMPMRLAELCQIAENQIVGAPCGIMDQVTSCLAEPGVLLRMICQPHELQPSLALPEGVRVLGINSNVRHDVGGPAYARTRCAAFMAHRIILEQIRQMGQSMGREMTGDPMRGYLANLDPDDYKRFFRPGIPATMPGSEFLSRFGPTIDPATAIEPDIQYPVQHAADHHVLEARRVRRFVEFLEQAATLSGSQRTHVLDRAGHLMYASHQSYTMDAMLGAPECDVLVDLVRRREPEGLFGARITGGGSGGTVAVLANATSRADAALAQILSEYEKATGHNPELLAGTSPGSWHVGTDLVMGD